jgi:hypothetical protein
MGYDIPILFLVFNRPDLTAEVMSVLGRLRPKRFFVAADGPRTNIEAENELCQQTRAIATAIDWECQCKTLFRDENLGCGPAVSSAITWFFEQVEEGIILEDDCLPALSFFDFCAYALERFRGDDRVGTISGNHFLPPDLSLEQPYYFSKYFQIWGWATWRRVWEKYRFDLSFETDENWQRILDTVHPTPLESKYWLEVLRGVKNRTVNTWDYQMMFISWRERFLHVAPSKNLVSNIGYRADATHTNFDSPLEKLPRNEIANFKINVDICALPQIDNLTFYVRFLESFRSLWWLQQALQRDIEQQLLDRSAHLDGRVDRLEEYTYRLQLSQQWIQRLLQSFRIALFAIICVFFVYAVLQIVGFSLPLGGLTVFGLALILGAIQLSTIGILRDWIGQVFEKLKDRLPFIK